MPNELHAVGLHARGEVPNKALAAKPTNESSGTQALVAFSESCTPPESVLTRGEVTIRRQC